MLPKEILSRACEFHEEFRRRLDSGPLGAPPNYNRVLRKIQDSDQQLMRFAFGDFGSSLASFVKMLDLDHPESDAVSSLLFGGEAFFSDKFFEFILLAEQAKASGLEACFPFLGQSVVREYISHSVQKKVHDGQLARSFLRTIRSKDDRERFRRSKKTQTIDLQALWKKGDDLWSSLPADFSRFMRFDSAYDKDISQATAKMHRYEEMGCTTLAEDMQSTINVFRETMQQSYCGFNRVTMTSAAVILAKFHGYEFVADRSISFGNLSFSGPSRVQVSQSSLGDYIFAVDEASPEPCFSYLPKVYCYHSLEEIASDEIKSVVNTLEEFPGACDRPIFDHYGVIVPSVIYNGLCLRDGAGLIHKFTDQQEVQCALDRSLVKTKSVVPILVGERDSKCYFITYWV